MTIYRESSAFVAYFTLEPSKIEQFKRAHQAIVDASEAFMDEQSHFIFYGWGRKENEWVAIESWKDQSILNGLRENADFQAGVRAMLECCAAPIRIEMFAAKQGDRSAFDMYPSGVSAFHPQANNQYVEFV